MNLSERVTRIFAPTLERSPTVQHRVPWAVVFTLPLALLALLWVTTREVPAALAVTFPTTTYAGCTGSSPNFATIQMAVSNTAPGGVVNI